METGIQRPRNDHSQVTSFERASELVVTGSQHCQGQIFVSNSSQQNNCHRCIHSDVGRESGSSDHTGFLVRGTKRTAHKLSGVGGSNLDYKKLPSTIEKSMCSGPFRQHNSNLIYLPSGRNSVSSAVLQNLGSLAVGYQKQYHFESSSHSGKIEHPTRPVEQNSDTAHRVDLERYSVEENFSDLGSSNNRSLCIVSQQEDGHLLHLGPSSPGVRCRCVFGNMESNVCVCIPTNLPDFFLEHMKQGHCQVILIAPQWPRRHWYPDLLQLCIANPIKLPVTHNPLSQPNTIIYHPDPKVFNLNAWLLSTDNSLQTAFHRKLETYCSHLGEQALKKTILVNSSSSVVGVVGNKLIHIQHL